MPINTIGNVLEQIQTQSQLAAGGLAPTQSAEETSQFSDILSNSINNINQLQTKAKRQTEEYMSGIPGIGLNDVMISLQKSSLALNLGVQVRNKLISAYTDIISMSV